MAADDDVLFRRLKKQFRADREFSAKWRKEAKEDFDFVAGEQWSQEDKDHLRAMMRPLVTFNRTQTVINAVSGQEMSNRQEVRFVPREEGDVKPNEMLSEGARWFRDQAQADDEDSEAFLHAITCGMGWTDTTLDFDKEEEGAPKVNNIDPLKMFWDKGARKHNLIDRKRQWYAESMTLGEAKEMFPDAEEGDLDAKWANEESDEGELKDQERERRYDGEGETGDAETDDDREVTVIHCQYLTTVTVHKALDPMTGEPRELSAKDFKVFKARLTELGLPVKATAIKRKEVRDCFIGGKILQGPIQGLCKDHFRYQCVTGFKDHNKGTFHGLVRGMKDPQRWSNKFFSQAMDLLNSQAKGGVVMEKGATEDMREFERTWARADKPTYVPEGTLSNPNGPRMIPKPVGQVPASLFQMMEFAISSVRDVPGVSVEMMGMADRDQPASLEYQRRQSGLTILQPLLKNLKRYRAEGGYVVLYILQTHMSDGRLIQIVGEEGAKYVPLVRQADVKYDIIIDDAPTSPNQKEMVWSMIGEHYFELSPELQMVFAEYLPLPSSIIEKIRKAYEEQGQSPAAQLQQAGLEAEVGLKQAQAQKTSAEAQKTLAETGMAGQPDPVKQNEVIQSQNAAQLDGSIKVDKHEADKRQAAEKHAMAMEKDRLEIERKRKELAALEQKLMYDARMAERSLQRMDIEESLMTEKHESDIENGAIKAESSGNGASKTKGVARQPTAGPLTKLTEQMVRQGDVLEKLAKAMTAPKRLIKDKSGKAIGVETVM